MVIYGLLIMSGCLVVGTFLGMCLGAALGISANVGGVGFGMLMLLLVTRKMQDKGLMDSKTEQGILFWRAMFIPVVIALVSRQNVIAALSGGWLAFVAGLGAVFLCFVFIRPLTALAGESSLDDDGTKLPAE
ncbi:malonate transporter subunit MadL [Breoghania sp.]|uniref:malonate transporter subunit MadL n=1 Tax=Breoghania sp. TaxID=2065378 RepID=UPI002AA68523|nr:malonate transporter subunit MadL [Breoghania sp.]